MERRNYFIKKNISCHVNIIAMLLKWLMFPILNVFFKRHKIRNEKVEIIKNIRKVQNCKNFYITLN